MCFPSPEEHLEVLRELQYFKNSIENMHMKIAADNIKNLIERIQFNYGYYSAQPIRSLFLLLKDEGVNDGRIYMLLSDQSTMLENYIITMSKYKDEHSILNDGWH
jgi:hypothetical protein